MLAIISDKSPQPIETTSNPTIKPLPLNGLIMPDKSACKAYLVKLVVASGKKPTKNEQTPKRIAAMIVCAIAKALMLSFMFLSPLQN